MGLGGIDQDVVFDHAGAARLAHQFRLTAGELDRQADHRPGQAKTASQEFRGRYSQDFHRRVTTGVGDARELAGALRRAAAGLAELSAAATREQSRRLAARAWQNSHVHHGWLSSVVDNVHDFVTGDDDVPPPPPPEPPYRFLSAPVVAGSR